MYTEEDFEKLCDEFVESNMKSLEKGASKEELRENAVEYSNKLISYNNFNRGWLAAMQSLKGVVE
jgi:indole-3-glycerol phosphate synthase